MCLFAVFFDFGVFLIHMMAVQHTSLTLMDCSLRRSSLLTILHTYMEHICFASSLRFSDDNYKNAATFKKHSETFLQIDKHEGKTTNSWWKLHWLKWKRFIYATISSGKRASLLLLCNSPRVLWGACWILRFTNCSCFWNLNHCCRTV